MIAAVSDTPYVINEWGVGRWVEAGAPRCREVASLRVFRQTYRPLRDPSPERSGTDRAREQAALVEQLLALYEHERRSRENLEELPRHELGAIDADTSSTRSALPGGGEGI
jgi:hypothetical protein